MMLYIFHIWFFKLLVVKTTTWVSLICTKKTWNLQCHICIEWWKIFWNDFLWKICQNDKPWSPIISLIEVWTESYKSVPLTADITVKKKLARMVCLAVKSLLVYGHGCFIERTPFFSLAFLHNCSSDMTHIFTFLFSPELRLLEICWAISYGKMKPFGLNLCFRGWILILWS